MDEFESKLISFGIQSVTVPDSDRFVLRLQNEIRRRREIRHGIRTTGLAIALITFITIGLFETLWLGTDLDYGDEIDFQFFSTLNEVELYSSMVYEDESFIWEAADYLIHEMDFIEPEWEMLQDLENLGVINLTESNG